MAHYGDPNDYHWDVVTGVSTGAINTCRASVFKPEDVVEFTEWLSDTWASVITADVWKWWPHEKLGLPFRSSLVDSSPALELLKSFYSL